jgi:hypothetical protein
MMVIYGVEADIAHPHFLRAYGAIARITLRHDLLELIVVLSSRHPGRRGGYELGSIQRRDLIHVHLAAEGLIEEARASTEELSYAGFHHLLSKCSYGLHGLNSVVHHVGH